MIQHRKQAFKVALITGAARRIGAATARHLHQAGFRIAIHYNHSSQEASALAAQLNHIRPDSAHIFQLNLEESTDGLINAIIGWAGQLDLLVNNASLFITSDPELFEAHNWQKMFLVNTQVPYILSLDSLPYLKKTQGAIINITDIHAQIPLKNYAVYCQTKAALLMQTRVLAKEFAPNVRVNAVAPGAIVWPEHENSLSPEIQQSIIKKTPLQRHGDPQFIAQAVLALAENNFVTGQVLNVDGGRSLG